MGNVLERVHNYKNLSIRNGRRASRTPLKNIVERKDENSSEGTGKTDQVERDTFLKYSCRE